MIDVSIPMIELLAQICINSEQKEHPKAPKALVRQKLRDMFEPCLGMRVGYAVEHLIVTAKAFGLVKEENEYLFAIIKPKEGGKCQKILI